MKSLVNFLDAKKDYSLLIARMIAGWRLIAGGWPFVMHKTPITDVQDFFIKINVPLPMISAYISVYAQFFCGLLFILGLWIRPAALIMLINFSVAIIITHMNDKIERSFPAWALFAFAILFLAYGAGSLSVDKIKNNK